MKKIQVANRASKGIAMGQAFIVEPQKWTISKEKIAESAISVEQEKFAAVVEEAVAELGVLAEESEIFAAHKEIAEDDTLKETVAMKIAEDGKNAQWALEEAVNEIVEMFEAMEDEYFRERAADIKDVGKRMMAKLLGVKVDPFSGIKEEVIVVAQDLSPSETATMDFSLVKGFVTELGGTTSHVAIMARSMGIPAFVGVMDFRKEVTNDTYLILDALDKEIVCDPTPFEKSEYVKKSEEYAAHKLLLEKIKDLPAATTDKHVVELYANAGSVADVKQAAAAGAEGIGLFRSEFLYMENVKFPTEDEQYEAYKASVEAIGHPMIIRTLDIGGDKGLPYYMFPEEENPFLGWRAIRISLELHDVFCTQLRAILRASAYGKIKIMYPMVTSLREIREANALLAECKDQLRAEGVAFDEDIECGIMIETPAAVMCAEDFAKEVNFFSIGTNDLTQYMLAVDRGNQRISHLYHSFHPAVLRSIHHVILAGHKAGIEVGMCGEFAGEELAVPILLGMGLDEFSMSSSEITTVKAQIRSLSFEECQTLAAEVCALSTTKDVMEYLDSHM
ncbi:phosphoenolpyruvate--protein phosphotransferase [Chakrabartyella piscis]|uniref:phosphoenolpyruvate--protein phosphotransferase n=1 Tax=Chakrabartyella piscis TaxID=2918914 RepID=UPI002958B443|nr:phosphoenolpyruvate--protein phosphotransferase [Chakrabartyella piscis]